MTLTKAELIDSVYEKVGFSKKEAAARADVQER